MTASPESSGSSTAGAAACDVGATGTSAPASKATTRPAPPGLDSIDTQLRQVDSELASLPKEHEITELREQYRRLTTTLYWTATRRVAGFERDCPAYLATTIGTPPAESHRREGWQRAAFAVEQYRLRWNVTEPYRPLGPESADPLQQEDHRCAAIALERHRHELDRGSDRGLEITLSR